MTISRQGWRRGAVATLSLLAFTVLVPPAWGASFGVNSTSDQIDAAVGDGVCASPASSCTLRAAIQEANALAGPDTIELPAGAYELAIAPLNTNDITTGDLDITEAVSIAGAGAGSSIVDGGQPKAGSGPQERGLDRIFEIAAPSGEVNLSGLTIRDGYAAEYGGGLFNAAGATVNLTDVAVTGSFAGKAGGAIDNHAGGAVHLTRADITGNSAAQSGGALNNNRDGTLSVIDSTVSRNSAAAVGADPAIAGAGAIANNADLDLKGTLRVVRSVVSANAAGGANPGGAISNDGAGSVEVTDSTLAKNVSQADGGAIFNANGKVTVSGGLLSGNIGDDGGAIGSGLGAEALTRVAGARIFYNQARADGGGIANNGLSRLVVSDTILTQNSASAWGGGVMNDDKGAATITGSFFVDNSALNGGGFANEGTGPVSVEATDFRYNTASGEGGGMHTNSVGTVSLSGGLVAENRAKDGGGVTNEGGGTVAISGATIAKNLAAEEGGGVLIQSGNVTLTGVDVLDNFAGSVQTGGGGIAYQGDAALSAGESASIVDSRVVGNMAAYSGGGIDSRGDGPLGIVATTIESNTAKLGGGIAHVGDAALGMRRSTLALNAAEHGGGLFTDGDGETTLENSTVSGNRGARFGGGLLVSSRLSARNATVTGNLSAAGGGINNGGGDLVGDGFVFLRNTIVAVNPSGGNCAGTITSLGGNIENADTCLLRGLSDQPATNPLLGPLAASGGLTRTHALGLGSPAQDAAVSSAAEPCPPADQRGVARPHGAGCDVGAHESELAAAPPPPGDCAGRAERVLRAGADAWIAQNSPASNFGADAILKVKAQLGDNSRALLRFALPSAPAGCALVGAKLRLHAASAFAGLTLQALRVSAAWSESDVSWSNQPPTDGAAATALSGLGLREWNVLEQTRAMYAQGNHGLLVRHAIEGGVGVEQAFHGREKGADRPPELVLTFDGPPPPPDTQPPDTAIGSANAAVTTDTDATFDFSSSERHSAFECSLDAAPFTPCEPPRALVGIDPGEHTFRVRATDSAGNTDPTPALFRWTVILGKTPARTVWASADGSRVLFETHEPLVSADTDAAQDIYERAAGAARLISAGQINGSGAFDATFRGASADGSRVFFFTAEPLVGADTDALADVYERSGTTTTLIRDLGPQTTIDSAPPALSDDSTPSFAFSANQSPGTSFECALDLGGFGPCSGPGQTHTVAVGDGSHTFRVRAVNRFGQIGPSAAEFSFATDTAAPETAIESGPAPNTADSTPSFGFSSSEPGSSFACRVDGEGFAPCSGPGATHTTAALSAGPHTFEVRATDGAGNADPSPASRSFDVAIPAPALRCGGRLVTLRGSAGPDNLRGSAGPDVVASLGGNDTISSLGGGDLICAGAGNDTVHAEAGDDRLFGGAGADRLFGEAGRDSLNGGAGHPDECNGGEGRDAPVTPGCELLLGIP